MQTVSTRCDLAIVWCEADRAAARLVRRFGLPAADRDDLRHDLLVDLLARVDRFDPRRGTLGAFAGIVIQHSAARLAARLRRDRARLAMMSVDDPMGGRDGMTLLDTFAEDEGYLAWMGSSTNPIAALEDRLSIHRALNTLDPEHINLCAELAIGSIGRASAESAPSRAGFMTSAWSSWRPESAHAHETAWHEDDFAIGNRHATAQWAPARRDRAVHVGWAGHHRRMAHLLPWIPRTRSIADSQSIASARSRGTSARRTPSVGASGSRSREFSAATAGAR